VASFAPLLLVTMPSSKAASRGESKAKAKDTPKEVAEEKVAGTAWYQVPGAPSVAISYTLVKMARYCLMFWLPYFLARKVGMDPTAAGNVSAALDLGGMAGAVLAGLACDRLYGGATFAISRHLCFATSACFAGWTAASASMGAVPEGLHVVAILLVGFSIAGPDGVLGGGSARMLVEHAGMQEDPNLAASVSAMINGCGSVGAVLQGVLTSKLVESAGWDGLFLTLAGAMLLAGLALGSAVSVEAEGLLRGSAKPTKAA